MEIIRMSAKERARLEVFGRVRAGDVTLVKASKLLGLSYRQTKRSWSRYREEGDVGLVHGLRGKASNRQGDRKKNARVLQLYAEKYSDYGPTLAAECLATDDGGDATVENIIREAARHIGRAVAGVVNLLGPDMVVLGGGLVQAMPELFVGEVRDAANQRVMPSFVDSFEVVAAQLGDDAGVMGAAAWAEHRISAE